MLDIVKSADRWKEDKLYDKELGELINAGINTLKEEFKEVFVLKEIQGLSLKEIADITESPLGTVKSRLRYAYQNLREVFRESGYFEERQKAKGVSSSL